MAKTLETLEQERNIFILGDPDLTKEYEDDEFTELLNSGNVQFVGMHHEDRVQFLKDNGHEVTRENMVNHELTAKPPTDQDAGENGTDTAQEV